ncbi:unnamed protein product [Discula destructiva]
MPIQDTLNAAMSPHDGPQDRSRQHGPEPSKAVSNGSDPAKKQPTESDDDTVIITPAGSIDRNDETMLSLPLNPVQQTSTRTPLPEDELGMLPPPPVSSHSSAVELPANKETAAPTESSGNDVERLVAPPPLSLRVRDLPQPENKPAPSPQPSSLPETLTRGSLMPHLAHNVQGAAGLQHEPPANEPTLSPLPTDPLPRSLGLPYNFDMMEEHGAGVYQKTPSKNRTSNAEPRELIDARSRVHTNIAAYRAKLMEQDDSQRQLHEAQEELWALVSERSGKPSPNSSLQHMEEGKTDGDIQRIEQAKAKVAAATKRNIAIICAAEPCYANCVAAKLALKAVEEKLDLTKEASSSRASQRAKEDDQDEKSKEDPLSSRLREEIKAAQLIHNAAVRACEDGRAGPNIGQLIENQRVAFEKLRGLVLKSQQAELGLYEESIGMQRDKLRAAAEASALADSMLKKAEKEISCAMEEGRVSTISHTEHQRLLHEASETLGKVHAARRALDELEEKEDRGSLPRLRGRVAGAQKFHEQAERTREQAEGKVESSEYTRLFDLQVKTLRELEDLQRTLHMHEEAEAERETLYPDDSSSSNKEPTGGSSSVSGSVARQDLWNMPKPSVVKNRDTDEYGNINCVGLRGGSSNNVNCSYLFDSHGNRNCHSSNKINDCKVSFFPFRPRACAPVSILFNRTTQPADAQ